MTILEGTLVLGLISGIAYGTLDQAEEVETRFNEFQETQKNNFQNVRETVLKGHD